MNHIDDDQLQDLLDGNLTAEERSSADRHLTDCPSCRERLVQYQALYRGLRDESEFVLPEGFAAAVAAQVEAPEESSIWMSWPVLGGASLIAVIATLFYLVGLDKILAYGQQLLLAESSFRDGLTAPIESVIASLGHRGELVFCGLLALVMVALLDSVVKAVRRGRAMLLM